MQKVLSGQRERERSQKEEESDCARQEEESIFATKTEKYIQKWPVHSSTPWYLKQYISAGDLVRLRTGKINTGHDTKLTTLVYILTCGKVSNESGK